MKKILIFIIYFVFYVNNSFSNGLLEYFNNTRVNYNYFGSIYNQDNIFIYGDAGIILKFDTDMNYSKKIIVNDSFNIVSMTSINSNIFGIFNKEYIFKSNNQFETWELKKITNKNLFKIITYNDKLICLSEDKFLMFDFDLNLLEEIPVNINGDNYDFTILSDNIIYPSDINVISFYNLKSKQKDSIIIDINDIKYGPSDFFINSGKVYFKINNKLFSYFEKKLKMYSLPSVTGKICSKEGKIFQLYNITYEFKNLDSLFFININENNTLSKINNNHLDRYITNLEFNSVNFLDEKLVLAVGNNNLIYYSNDGGVRWNLVSYLDLKSSGIIKRMSKSKALRASKGIKFTQSYYNGIIWKPQKNYEDYFYSELRFKDFNNNPGFIISEYKNNEYFAFYDTEIQGDTNIAYSENEGEVIKLKNANNLIGLSIHNYKKYIFPTKSGDIFSYPCNIYDRYFNYFFKFDENLNFKNLTFLDSVWVVNLFDFQGDMIAVSEDFRDYFKDYKTKYLSFYISTNNGNSWVKQVSLDFLSNYIAIFSNTLIDDFLFLILEKEGHEFDIGFINLHNYEFKKILSLPNNSYPSQSGVMKIGNNYFFISSFLNNGKILTKTYFNNIDFKDSSKWEQDLLTSRYNILNVYNNNDSLFTIYCYDSLLKKQVIFFSEPKNDINFVEQSVEFNSNLYISQPYPNPAKNEANFTIYYNKNSKIDNIKIKIYDIMGNLIATDQDVNIASRNSYSLILTWYCYGYAPGVYIISININGNKGIQTVVLSK